jgi:hypothetical protein
MYDGVLFVQELSHKNIRLKCTSLFNGSEREVRELQGPLKVDTSNLILLYLLLQSSLQPVVGFRPAQLSLSILSRKVLQSAVILLYLQL